MAKVTEREASKALGKSRGALQEARKRGDLVRSVSRDKRGRLLIDVAVAREELEEAAAMRVTTKGDGDEALQRWRAARARLAEAQATLTEDELATKRGALVEAANLDARLVGEYTRAKTRILGVPTRAKQQMPHLSPKDVVALEDLLREALEALADGR